MSSRDAEIARALDEMVGRIVDAAWLEREDLSEPLAQMRGGEGTIRIPNAD